MHFSGNTGRPIAALETEIRKAKLDTLEVGLIQKLEELDAQLKVSDQPFELND